jgi:hypothetical protein
MDGSYIPDSSGNKMSLFTLHLYLNGHSDTNPLRGGATAFWNPDYDYEFDFDFNTDNFEAGARKRRRVPRIDVEPKPGRVLVFQHEGLVHSGDDVLEGVKYTMRTDLMYERVE